MTCSTVADLREDTAALRQLAAIEELVNVPPIDGGVYLLDPEREFVRRVRAQFDVSLTFTTQQREMIAALWAAIERQKQEKRA